ncbi:MAG TPA: tetratricopeptide repeat protein [Myxococcales bacterium]|nr:tetratricopeptide repeat protein [Myxococcales bacterium]
MRQPGSRQGELLIAAALVLGTLALYARVGGYDFIWFDDNRYVVENRQVLSGLTLEGMRWAFTATHASNWHPLTWLSHMLDVQIFGLDAGAHHLVNAALHAVNAALVYAVVRRLTGLRGRSLCVAVLFAVHPLHVESVAWVAERKDLLSTLFGLLSLWAWAAWVERPRWQRYALVALCFSLSLLAKPMWVTLPALLLLLDFWPLARGLRVVEKLPLLALSLASSAATALAQRSSITDLSLPIALRLENVVVAYARYVAKTFWPWPLSLHYPYPTGGIPAWQIGAALFLLAAITLAAVGRARTAPWMLVGWLWFVGTLVPVIGIVQVGTQSMADRYTYLPLLGLFIALVWTVAEAFPRAAVPAAAVASAALCVVTSVQLSYWSGSEKLFRRGSAIEPLDATLHAALSDWLRHSGRLEEAVFEEREAARLDPHRPALWNNLAALEAELHRLDDAVGYVSRAIEEDAGYAKAWDNLGHFELQRGNVPQAAAALQRAVRLAPGDALAHEHFGTALLKLGRLDPGVAELRAAVGIDPMLASAWTTLGIAEQSQGRAAEAQQAFRGAVRANPLSPMAWRNLGLALAMDGRRADAAVAFAEALRLRPGDPDIARRLAEVDSAPAAGTQP